MTEQQQPTKEDWELIKDKSLEHHIKRFLIMCNFWRYDVYAKQ